MHYVNFYFCSRTFINRQSKLENFGLTAYLHLIPNCFLQLINMGLLKSEKGYRPLIPRDSRVQNFVKREVFNSFATNRKVFFYKASFHIALRVFHHFLPLSQLKLFRSYAIIFPILTEQNRNDKRKRAQHGHGKIISK